MQLRERLLFRCLLCLTVLAAFALLLVSLSPASAKCAVQEHTAVTKVKGLELNHAVSAKSKGKLVDWVDVSPAKDGRKVILQSRKNRAWVNVRTSVCDARGMARIVYPNSWRKANATAWRVVVPGVGGAQGYESTKITIVTRNRARVKLAGKAALLMDADSGRVFYAKHANRRRQIASITKVMTALLALERCSLGEQVLITRKAANTAYSNLGKKAIGDHILLRNLLYMALLPSDNGAATAIGLHVGGSKAAFVKMMNARARQLGCKNTVFKNANGLDGRSAPHSTAADVARIMAKAAKNPTFCKIVGTKKYRFSSSSGRKYKVVSTDELLGKLPGLVGGKTGYTSKAGSCFCGIVKRHGHTYITVTLGSGYASARWSDTRRLARYLDRFGL